MHKILGTNEIRFRVGKSSRVKQLLGKIFTVVKWTSGGYFNYSLWNKKGTWLTTIELTPWRIYPRNNEI